MIPSQRTEVSQLPADGHVSQCVGQSQSCVQQIQRQSRLDSDGWGLALQPVFQDSDLSPALPLLPARSEHAFTEYSLFQHSDSEFVPLRAYPDVSMASERFHVPRQDGASECGSLSQHPLVLEEGANSCLSLSQHSLCPGEEDGQKEASQLPLTSRDDAASREKDSRALTGPADKPGGEDAEDETFFLRKEIPAQHLLELLQKDMGMPSSSSSAVSSASETSVKTAASLTAQSKDTHVCTVRREGPSGEASHAQKTQQPERDLCPDGSRTSEVCNITTGPRDTRPDDDSEELHRELLSEVERRSGREKSPTPPGRPLTHQHTETSEGLGVSRRNVGRVPWTGPFSAGHREPDLWSPGNQTRIDGSYLGFLPQSQSTPGVFKAPSKSSVKAALGQLSAIESSKDDSEMSPQPAPSDQDVSSAKVQALPSLTYQQKVDAWRANQSSGKTSLFDSLALQGFSGVSPKKKAFDAVSDTLNRILSQQARSLQQQPPRSGSASRRGEAVGSDPDNTGSATRPSASPFDRSQSHSSLSTVVTSARKPQQTERLQDDVHLEPSGPLQPSPLASLGHFIDVSPDRDLTSSQDSYNSGIKPGTSIGASSVVSLEVDNYAPYWTSKPSTPPPPPRPRELNIEERIPLYLQNLGIDQSPSTILTPFAPRGPIREPEFSPTDFCTIKGSIGTPTRSAQLSEGGTPHKGEFSRSSLLSVDSSMSLPISLDSLGPAASVPERPERPSPSSDIEDIQSERRLAVSSQLDEDSYPSTMQQQRDSSVTSSQNTIQRGERSGSDLSLAAEARCVGPESEVSFVSSKALLEIRKLLSQAENAASASSSSPAAPRLLSDDDIFLSLRKKASGLQDSSFSSSATRHPRSPSSLLWGRSSSDSMLSSDKLRESSVCRESLTSSGRPSHPSAGGRGADSSFVLSQSARRAEPEGCSAAPPDNKAPPAATVPSPAPSAQLTSMPADPQGATEEEQQSSSSSPGLQDDDQAALSDGSSESSLAIRVAQLLQSESPATMMSSTPSVTDQEEGKAREWIKLKISGQRCEHLELDKEDRKRIEEIKRELLKSQGSTDTESSAASSLRVLRGDDQQAETFSTLADVNKQQSLDTTDPSESSEQLQNPQTDLEAQIRDIATREGVTLPKTNPRALTSITISTRRRSTSPSPTTSPVPEPLDPTEPSTGGGEQPEENRQLHPTMDEETKTDSTNQNVISASAPVDQKRQDAVGGRFEEPPSPSQGPGGDDDVSVQYQASRSSTPEPPTRTGQVSHIHLTLSPKASDLRPAAARSRADFASVRHSPASSSPDEGVGSSSPLEWHGNREPIRGRADTSTLLKPAAPQRRVTSTSSPSFTARHRGVEAAESPAAPVLLPYKPRGSHELFYVPQTEADRSDTTMESSHTGSDDAVPPRFSSEVLGHRDPGLDRGVTIRHTEGIYSKRLRTDSFKKRQEDEDEAAHKGVSADRRLLESSQVSVSRMQEVSRTDWGTGPLHVLTYESGLQRPEPLHVDRGSARPPARPGSSLDQLWLKFCERWSPEESQPTNDREASLLERLERLSRLLHSTKGGDVSKAVCDPEDRLGRRTGGQKDTEVRSIGVTGSGQARTQCLHPADDDSTSSFSHSSQSERLVLPADRDEWDTSSTTSNSMSTVDTARLIRAFGAHRVRHLKTSSTLSKLYDTINKQRDGREQRTGRQTPDSESTHGASTAAKVVKVSRGIQAGDLELVKNGTRRHTRDVGTTFLSPGEASSSSSLERGGGRRSRRSRRSRSSPAKTLPEGLSWFISADELRAEARKENRPEEEEEEVQRRPSTAWFKPYSRVSLWREPLRQRQVHPEPEPRTKPRSSGPTHISLQEALELRRPEFISRSRQRVERLALQAEQRKLQEAFSRERHGLFSRAGRPERPPRPAGGARLTRAVPRKEMIQRSKQ
ncbi:Alstrom syndrome protein 1 [Collichthys lucidus]|uniref:Alstrom syndrome protein 1 n=1 Tax=Collichthys lucidus TaxID=240159 RepID=A0A4U5VJH3_COLLU|nr:Alstrom syndrome protein 1 [Collichthys lucidus]